MSLILGAVQFGVPYGVTNHAGKPSQDAAFEAIQAAWDAGIRTLDSAQGYGQANQVIADYHAAHKNRFSVINKIMRHPQDPQEVIDSLLRERDQMQIERFDCIMFHYAPSVPDDLPHNFLDDLKKKGLTARVGLSIDIPANYESLQSKFSFDVIQLPLNLMSQKFMPIKFLEDLQKSSTEIHVRSAFLQGVLLNKPEDAPSYLAPLAGKIRKFQDDCESLDITPLIGCLLFLLQNPLVDHIVVGAQNAGQLREIVAAYQDAETAQLQGKNLDWLTYASDDFAMIHPLSWLEMAKKA